MFRTIFLLAPVFVSIFWAFALAGNKNEYSTPRLFLSKFMLFAALIFTAHFLYFAPFPDVYIYFDLPLQLVGITIFPLYHIYFRLLTVDKKFSFRAHTRYFIVPLIIGLVYGFAVLLTPFDDYKLWLYHLLPEAKSGPAITFLTVMRIIVKITFILTLIISMISNYTLMKKYGHIAEQFYSDIQDTKLRNVKRLNNSLLAIGFVSLVIVLTGRFLIIPFDALIYAGWSMFAFLLFIIGDSGIKQKIMNPSCEVEVSSSLYEVNPGGLTAKDSKALLGRIITEFHINRIYLNSELTIMDLVKVVGTNRTYISSVINQNFNTNFCSFVNGFRIEELEQVMLSNPGLSNEELAQCCGFGSVNSLKRAISAKKGISLKAFRQESDNKRNSEYPKN
jgi:AraC-like DNA-binding protein